MFGLRRWGVSRPAIVILQLLLPGVLLAQQTSADGAAALDQSVSVVRRREGTSEPLEVKVNLHFQDLTAAQLKFLGQCSELERLSFQPSVKGVAGEPRTKLSALIESLRGLKKLKSLSLALPRPRFDTRTLRDDDLKQLAKLTGLEELDLSRQPLKGDGVIHLAANTNLRRLILDESAVGAEAIAGLGKCEHLESASILDTPLQSALFGHVGENGLISAFAFLRDAQSGNFDEIYNDLADRNVSRRVNDPKGYFIITGRMKPAIWIRYLLARVEVLGLDLTQTDVTDQDLEMLAGNSALKSLQLDHTKITDKGLQSLVNLPVLRLMTLRFTKTTPAGVKHLVESLPLLTFLRLDDSQLASDADWPKLAKVLRILHVHVPFKDRMPRLASLKDCNGLESLHVHCQAGGGDEDLEFVSGLPNLTELTVDHVAGGCGFLNRLPRPERLVTLSLNAPRIDERELRVLTKMTSLKHLNISGSSLSGGCVKHFGALEQLETLDLVRTGMMQGNSAGAVATKDEMAAFAALKELRTLELSGIQLSSDGFVHLAKLSKLKDLQMYRVDVDDRIVPHLKPLQSLDRLKISLHRLSAAGRKELAEAFPREQKSPRWGFLDGGPAQP